MRRLLSHLSAVILGMATASARAEGQSPEAIQAPQDAAAASAPAVLQSDHHGSCRRDGFQAGGTLYYLKPHWTTNPAYSTEVGAGALGPFSATGVNFSWDYEPAFGIWAGYTNSSGLGFRGRYFRFDQDVNTDVVHDGTPFLTFASAATLRNTALRTDFAGDALSFSSRLHLQSADAELTQEWRNGCWSVVLGGGFRYAYVSQSYASTIGRAGGLGTDEVAIGHNFTGYGMTSSLDARRTVGDLNLTLFGTARGSFVWGTWRQRDLVVINADVLEQGSIEQDRFLPILELELGAEWSRAVGRARVFAAGGAATQVWFNAGNASNNDHFFSVDDGHSNDANLALVGFFVRAGIRY